MAAWPSRLLKSLDQNDAQARAIAGSLTAEQLNWNPTPRSWSVAQCLEHLLEATGQYRPNIAKALVGRTPAPVEEITPGWFAAWFIRTCIDPDERGRKFKAPGKIIPPA